MRALRWTVLIGLTAVLAACGGAPPTTQDEPAGTELRLAYPDVPVTWSGLDPRDTAAVDLFAVWGLPLFRVDHAGQLRPGLATAIRHPEGAEGWAVEVDLAAGAWSDGEPVTAADVAATAEALASVRPGEWDGTTVTAVDEDTVRFAGAVADGRWAYLLTGAPGVLPEHVLSEQGLDAYAADVPVSGGWFRLRERELGRRVVFDRHATGPLGPPRSARVTVDIVPRFDAALGLLARGEADVALGHLALNAEERAQEVAGVRAAAPVGGTWVGLEWSEDGALEDDPEARRRVADALDLSELVTGLLGPQGAPASSPVPGVDGPWSVSTGGATGRDITTSAELVLLVPRWHEALGFTSRVLQRDVRVAGGTLALVGHESPITLAPPEDIDVAMRVVRSLPRPAVPDTGTETRVAVGPAAVVGEELAPAFAALREREAMTPLYRVGVAHAWRDDVTGVRASSWPGLALWDVGAWDREG